MNTTLAQVILIVLVIALGLYVFVLRSRIRDRVAMLLLALIGVVLVAWPGLSTDVANFVGIGRGTDLLFYLFIVFCLFRFVSQAASTRRLEERLTVAVREAAIANAKPPGRRPETQTPAGQTPSGDAPAAQTRLT